jgi:hypothetical protein
MDEAKDDQTEMQKRLSDAVKALIFASVEQAIETPGKYNPASLNPWNVNTTVKTLDSKGLLTPDIERALRWIAAQKDKRDQMEIGVKMLEIGIGTASMSPGQKLEATKEALSWFLGPETSLMTAGSDYVVGLAFAAHAKFITQPEIERLNALNESDLQQLRNLSSSLENDIHDLRAVRAKYENCVREHPAFVSTKLGKQGFLVHWADYPAPSTEARPLILYFSFRNLNGESAGGVEVSDGGKSGLRPPTGLEWVSTSAFEEADPGEYIVKVQAYYAYSPVPWGGIDSTKEYGYEFPPGEISQPEEGYRHPLLEFRATVQRWRTTEIIPRFSRKAPPPPEEFTLSHVYDPVNGSVRGFGDPLFVNKTDVEAINFNRRSGEPLAQLHTWKGQKVFFGFSVWRDIEPACPIDGRKYK